MAVLSILLYILFCFSAFVLIVVILLQEGKGGGFGQALGDHGQQTFGVGSKGINTFTGVTAGVFLASAIVLHMMAREAQGNLAIDSTESVESALPPGIEAGLPSQQQPGN